MRDAAAEEEETKQSEAANDYTRFVQGLVRVLVSFYAACLKPLAATVLHKQQQLRKERPREQHRQQQLKKKRPRERHKLQLQLKKKRPRE